MSVADPLSARAITHSESDIDDVAWSRDGVSLIVSSHPRVRELWRGIEQEARTGYYFDGRFSPMTANHPFPDSTGEERVDVVELASNQSRPASAAERALVDSSSDPALPAGAILADRASDGRYAWTQARDSSMVLSANDLHATAKNGRSIQCMSTVCEDAIGLWWTPDGKSVRYLRREGWGRQ